MQVTISIKRRDVYGVSMIYICEPEFSEAVGQLTGKKTINDKDVDALKKLGVIIRDIDQEIKDLFQK